MAEKAMVEYALEYARKGIRVLPLWPRSKVAALKEWPEEATTDEAQIRTWWANNPNYNIGVAAGHGLVIIDVDDHQDDEDPRNRKYGFDTLRKWEQENGELPPTWTVVSGHGGLHYWYKTPVDYQNGTEVLEDIDLRGAGGYVVAPPSIHENGKPYEWEAAGDPEDIPIAELSGSALKLVQQSRKRRTRTEKGPGNAPYKEMTEIGKGHRQAALMALQGSLKNLNLTDEAIRAAVRAENEAKCNPPMTDEELEKEIFPFLTRDIQAEGDWAETVTPTDGSEFADQNRSGFLPQPVNLRDIWDHLPEVPPELIEGILRQGHKMIISASSKAGKSFLLLELALAIAEGMNWLGSRCRKGKVLYINLEIEDASCYQRIHSVYSKIGLNVGNHVENITVWPLRGRAKPLRQLMPEILDYCKGKHFEAIIFDPLYKILDGDENSNTDMAKMSSEFDTIARETGASVVYAHHFAKGYAGDRSSVDRGSGAGVLARDPDAILTMTQLDLPDDVNDMHTGWRVEFTLREFAEHDPVDVWWEFPLHRVDSDGALENRDVVSTQSVKAKRSKSAKTQQRNSTIEAAYENCEKVDDQGGFLINTFIEAYLEAGGTSGDRNTVARHLKASGFYMSQSGPGKAGVWHRKPDEI